MQEQAMTTRPVALYARVSSEQQADARTIASQLADLRARIKADGFDPAETLAFVDDGYSGASLIRPALECLRDRAAAGELQRLYVHCPDRLARNYAHQVIVLEELTRAGVEVVFLNRAFGQTPEDQLLVQVQGVIAEYERAKFLERSRRGKRYAAQVGRVSVLAHAPFGYRYVRAAEAGGEPRLDVVLEEARVVRQVFTWVGHERATLGEVRRRLHAAGIATRTGKPLWDRKTIWDMLRNPVYIGQAAFGRTRSVPLQPRLRAPRGRPAQSRRGYTSREVPPGEWITIPVPALVDVALFETVQEQLRENQQRARIPAKGTRYLLQGLLVCAQCGYAFYARTNDARNAYYRCSASDAARFGGTRLCANQEVRMDLLDRVVWHEVQQLLAEPERLEEEYRRRLSPQSGKSDLGGLESQRGKLRRGIARLIDSYAEGLIDDQEFEPRIRRLRERLQQAEQQVLQLQDQAQEEEGLRLILNRLEIFATQVKQGLDQADWNTRREIIRTLVKRVEVDRDQVRVVFRVGPPLPSVPPEKPLVPSPSLQHCGESVLEARLESAGGE
jgi:site-specific DNA recombinase